MLKSIEIPDCYYYKDHILVKPRISPPRHSLYLSSLDDQIFLRFSVKYLYLYRTAVNAEALEASLSRALEDYYPLAGRLKYCEVGEKLEVDCNGEGAVLAEGYVALSADEFLSSSSNPNLSWRKFLCKIDLKSFVGVPPLVVQVSYLRCGGMVLCAAIHHSVCDGIGSAHFLRTWAHYTSKLESRPFFSPFHSRHALMPRSPPTIQFSHPEFKPTNSQTLTQILQSQPLVPVSVTFVPSEILQLKKQCAPSIKCTSFEVLASHVWRTWIRSIELPRELRVKLLFSVNIRNRMNPPLAHGFYGNAFVLACANGKADDLLESNIRGVVDLLQSAKARIDDQYVRSTLDFLALNRVKPDMSATLVISQWAKIGLEEADFGEGGPLHVGPLSSEIYCLLLPVIGDLHAFTVLLSVPERVAGKFKYHLKDLWREQPEKDSGAETG